MAVLVSSFSIHGVLLPIQPTPNIGIAPFVFSRNDRDNVYGSPGGLFSEYSAGAVIPTKWEISGLSGEFIPMGGYTNKESTALDNPLLILDVLLGNDIPKKEGNWVVGFNANQYLYAPKQPSSKEVQATPFLLQPEGIAIFARFH
jgi:hypothetical protein